MKFKDGITVTQNLGDDFNVSGQSNLFDLLKKGKANNRAISLDTQDGVIEKKYSDLYSIEIIVAD